MPASHLSSETVESGLLWLFRTELNTCMYSSRKSCKMCILSNEVGPVEEESWGRTGQAKLEKVFLPPGASFLRQNFPNMEEEFS